MQHISYIHVQLPLVTIYFLTKQSYCFICCQKINSIKCLQNKIKLCIITRCSPCTQDIGMLHLSITVSWKNLTEKCTVIFFRYMLFLHRKKWTSQEFGSPMYIFVIFNFTEIACFSWTRFHFTNKLNLLCSWRL